ncbi:MAG: TolB family protein, partial [Acidimicrobiales bacterium]
MHRTSWSLLVGIAVATSALLTAPMAAADPAPTPTTTAPGPPPTSTASADVVAFGDAAAVGSTGILNQPIVALAASPSGNGYWVVSSDGGIFGFGDAHYYGSAGGIILNQPIVGFAPTPDGGGYWFVASDGGVFRYGDAGFFGSTGGMHLNQPIVGMAATPSGNGYWLVARDGGIFAFGDAVFYGSTGNVRLNKPIVGMAAHPGGHGYWFVASDGGIFGFGEADFHGSTGDLPIASPVVGMAATPDGLGYWLATSQGVVYNFGDAVSGGGIVGAIAKPVVAIAPSPTGHGYWLATSSPTALQSTNAGTGPPIGPSPLVRGMRILYTDNETSSVFTANTDGGFRRAIPTGLVADSVQVSPDDKTAIGESDTGRGQLAIGIQGVDGSNPRLLTQPSTAYIDTSPAWSRNGQRIAWIRTTQGAATAGAHAAAVDQATSGLWIMNADGSGQTHVDNTFDATGQISWSPDGSRVAFTACSPSTEGC